MDNDTNTGATLNTNKGYTGLLLIALLIAAAGYAGNYLGQKKAYAAGQLNACEQVVGGAIRLASSFGGGEAFPGTANCVQENGITYFNVSFMGKSVKAPLDLSQVIVNGKPFGE